MSYEQFGSSANFLPSNVHPRILLKIANMILHLHVCTWRLCNAICFNTFPTSQRNLRELLFIYKYILVGGLPLVSLVKNW